MLGGTVYRTSAHRTAPWTAAPLRIGPHEVRGRDFARTPMFRRGLDAHDVHLFLDRVADELAALRAELARSRDENIRIKRALRDWQAAHASAVR